MSMCTYVCGMCMCHVCVPCVPVRAATCQHSPWFHTSPGRCYHWGMQPRHSLRDAKPTVHGQRSAIDVFGFVGSKKTHGVRDVLRPTQSARQVLVPLLLDLWPIGGKFALTLGVHPTRRNRVHLYLVLGQCTGHALG